MVQLSIGASGDSNGSLQASARSAKSWPRTDLKGLPSAPPISSARKPVQSM
jgi:hypothetical protein